MTARKDKTKAVSGTSANGCQGAAAHQWIATRARADPRPRASAEARDRIMSIWWCSRHAVPHQTATPTTQTSKRANPGRNQCPQPPSVVDLQVSNPIPGHPRPKCRMDR